jgi:hypothetical protein
MRKPGILPQLVRKRAAAELHHFFMLRRYRALAGGTSLCRDS